MTGPELETFCEEINGGASIGATVLFQFINLAKAMVEQTRPWVALRYTDTSKSVSAGNTWQTAIDLSAIARFNRFYGETPIKLFDGANGIQYFTQVPFDKRLEYRNAPCTFVYDEAAKYLYLNGTIQFAGTLYIDHIKDSPEIANEYSSTWIFPSWAHPLLGFYAVAINKGGVDYDDINARMAPDNSPHKVAEALRAQGDCDEGAWTFDRAIDTVEKFYAPVPDALKTLAKEFVAEWKFNHDWVPTPPHALWDALQYSPMGISVYAWVKDEDGLYYKPDPRVPDTHWCTVVAAEYGEYWLVLDSYMDGGELYKKVRWDTPFMQAKRYGIERQANVQSAGWQWFAAFLKSLWPFPVITPAPEVPVKPRETPPAAPESPAPPPTAPPAREGDEKLIAALIRVESRGNDSAIGDKNLIDHAYGGLQIRRPYVDDANGYLGTSYEAQDCLGNRALSIRIFRAYMARYKLATDEQKARAHNGGASAARPGTKMNKATDAYWAKVKLVFRQ